MIKILGDPIDIHAMDLQNGFTDMEQDILQRMAVSSILYTYPSIEQLKFELTLRSHIVSAAKALDQSGVDFAGVSTSRC
ncbi:protein-glutamine gamma-glutamyltransferase, partial [Cohnella sp. REN36]|nr:protein-glutamine gamma-glutamyltransferase [Cohnella sp. REN36]